jgi:hypothetical protein
LLKVWAGDPSYESITSRVNAAWTAAGRPVGELAGKTTVVGCQLTRRHVDSDRSGNVDRVSDLHRLAVGGVLRRFWRGDHFSGHRTDSCLDEFLINLTAT